MSRRYQLVDRSVSRLRRALLPRTFSATGQYRNPETVHLRTASFRVLCHSEIESFLEDVALELYSEAWNLWDKHSWPSHTLTCILGFSDVATSRPAEALSDLTGSSYADIRVPLTKANNVWRDSHRKNNGVKEANVLRLFLPIGISATDLDQTLLNDLNSFGISRGEVAHRSSTGVATLLDPRAEYDTVRHLVGALRPLDALVAAETVRLRRTANRLQKKSSFSP